jgi:hypothetical protein
MTECAKRHMMLSLRKLYEGSHRTMQGQCL